jgi:hypothetical protein
MPEEKEEKKIRDINKLKEVVVQVCEIRTR